MPEKCLKSAGSMEIGVDKECHAKVVTGVDDKKRTVDLYNEGISDERW